MIRIADETGLAATSIRRHRDSHLGPKLADALARREEIDADKLLDWLTGLHDKTLMGIARTEAKADWGAMRGFIREARANIELLGRLAGIIDPAPSTFIDARRQTAVLAALSEEELRAIAAAAVEGEQPSEPVPQAFPALVSPYGDGHPDVAPARVVGGHQQ